MKSLQSAIVIEDFNQFDFHDVLIGSINFRNEDEIQLVITALPFNKDTNEYERYKMSFLKISELKTDEIFFDREADIVLYSFDYEYNGGYTCKMTFLVGNDHPPFRIDLKCDHIEMVKKD